jgi:hypothetical protein
MSLDIIREALETYGRPTWVAAVPVSMIIKTEPSELRELLAQFAPEQTADDKYRTLDRYAKRNLYELVTVAHLADISGLSDSTVRKYIKENPGTFRKMNHTQYELRDAQADRQHERSRA